MEVFQGNEFEGVDVGGFEDDGGCFAGFEGFDPAGDAEAPVVSGLQAWKIVLFDGGGKVVAHGAAEFEEVSVGDDADGVKAFVIGTGAAVAIAIETGERGIAAGLQGLSKDVAGHGND